MVKFRGIEISIISQFDIRKLPEFRYLVPHPTYSSSRETKSTSNTNSIASCYVPIYPGSQIWLEYSIDGPHPPNAAYLFKLLLDDNVVTSWDCVGTHGGYHGKMMYNLVCEGTDEFTGDMITRRQALRFGREPNDEGLGLQKGCMEIRIHRVEHRQRIKDLQHGLGEHSHGKGSKANLLLVDSGLLEPGFPKRRYKYQLLDPIDEPYAIFRFYYRNYEYLEASGVIHPTHSSPSTSQSACQRDQNTPTLMPAPTMSDEQVVKNILRCTPVSSPETSSVKLLSPQSGSSENSEHCGETTEHGSKCDGYLPPSDSDESLSIVTKDSVEDLPSTVPRSPRSPRVSKYASIEANETETPPPSPVQPPCSPRRRLKKRLTINLNDIDFDLEKKRRPLSPFTSGGVLRKIVDSIPPSAPAAVTEFGPTVNQEVEERLVREREAITSAEKGVVKTTRAERGGKSLMNFLGRRVGSH